MKLQVLRDMLFMKNGNSRDYTTIPKGTVLTRILPREIPKEQRAPYMRMQQRMNRRVVFFEWDGEFRSALIGQDVNPLPRERIKRTGVRRD